MDLEKAELVINILFACKFNGEYSRLIISLKLNLSIKIILFLVFNNKKAAWSIEVEYEVKAIPEILNDSMIIPEKISV